MIKKVLATVGVAAAVLGAAAPVANAVGDDKVETRNGNHSHQSYGNTGPGSPQAAGSGSGSGSGSRQATGPAEDTASGEKASPGLGLGGLL
ncbi:hypothetical protein [Streptomyces sp. NPDC047928]|uniref:hypothetical protein n=1 Tax=unclassified Streptomyces TaxID=2593676 RepID=UPI0037191E33